MVRVIWHGLAAVVHPFAAGVVMIFPDKVVGIREGVRLKIERTLTDERIARATAEREEQSRRDDREQVMRSVYFVLHSDLPQKLFVRYLTGKCFTNDGVRLRGVTREKLRCATSSLTGNGPFENWKWPRKTR